MLDQTFSLIDIPRLFTLTFLEGILSVDNALALALIVRHLPSLERKKALFVGLISAIIMRAFGILAAAYLIQIFWIQIVGGTYLLYLVCAHFLAKSRFKEKKEKPKRTYFWKVVILVELTDFAFAVDSILAGLAMIGIQFNPPHLPPKIWIVYFGGVMGIILMRFAAKLFTSLIDRFPGLELGAHLIVGWIALKLILEASLKALYSQFTELPLWGDLIFWVGIVIFFASSFFLKKKNSLDSNSSNR